MKIYLANKSEEYKAVAEYDVETNQCVVLSGSIVSSSIAQGSFRSAKSVEKLRNSEHVSGREVMKNIVFKSPSTAANFITGRSTNGLLAWKSEDGKKLKDVLSESQK